MAKIRKALERWKGPSIDFQAIANDDKHPEHHLYVSKTKQSLHKETDIKNIIRKARQGVVTHVNEYEAKYGDATALDFQTALNLVNETNEWFADLPVHIRNHFENDPQQAIALLDGIRANSQQAILEAEKIGMIDKVEDVPSPPRS
jgi:phage internal scaffolding protein